jgi:AcrR family transcriptional regulator
VQDREVSVDDGRRARIFRALAVAVGERGLRSVTFADIAATAGVPPRALRDQFATVEDGFLAAFEWVTRRAGSAMAETYEEESRWMEGVRAGLATMLELIEQEPELARLWIVYSLGSGPKVLRRRAAAIATLCEYIDRGRQETAARAEPPSITAEGVVGAVLAVLQARLLASRPAPVNDLLGELTSIALLPYLGSTAAKRELARPAPPWPPRPRHPGNAPVEGVGMRLTYRTARVLTAIAERPGSNNREVGDRAEVVDQGQISKLLSRLEAQGMIVNSAPGGRNGAPNAWLLTPRGEQVEHVVSYQAEESGALLREQAPRLR